MALYYVYEDKKMRLRGQKMRLREQKNGIIIHLQEKGLALYNVYEDKKRCVYESKKMAL